MRGFSQLASFPRNRTLAFFSFKSFSSLFQELSPTVDINLVVSLMRLMEAQMDEFKDPVQLKKLKAEQVTSWLEVSLLARLDFNLSDRS